MIATRRATLAGLMGLIVVAAVGMAGLKQGTLVWATVTFTIVAAVLLGSIVLAILAPRDGSRAFWVAFAIFGWGYAIIEHESWIGPQGPPLPGRLALIWLETQIHPQPQFMVDQGWRVATATVTPAMPPLRPGSPPRWTGNLDHYRQVGHSLLALASGLAGGTWAAWIDRRRRGSAAHTTTGNMPS